MSVRIFGIAGSSNSAEDFRLAASGLFVPTSQINDRTGVTSTPVLTGTGNFTCTVGPFSCVIDGTSNSLQGAYWATLDTATTVTINAANTQARIDLISLQIQDNAYDGSGQQRGQIVYTAGTPGSGVAPNAPANSISLWTVPVAANATSVVFGNVTAVFPYAAAAGGIVPVRTAADQPAVASGVQYRHRLDVSAGSGASPTEWSTNGTTWTPVYDPSAAYGSWTNLNLASGFVVNNSQPQYRTAPGGRIELRGCALTSGSVAHGSTIFTNPVLPSSPRYLPLSVDALPIRLQISSGTGALVSSNGTTIPSGTVIGIDGLSYTP